MSSLRILAKNNQCYHDVELLCTLQRYLLAGVVVVFNFEVLAEIGVVAVPVAFSSSGTLRNVVTFTAPSPVRQHSAVIHGVPLKRHLFSVLYNSVEF